MLPVMVEPTQGHSTGLQHLTDEAELLRQRLHRVAVALTLTEERIADTFDTLAGNGGPSAEQHRLEAKRAKQAAVECRSFVARLEEIERDIYRPYP